MVGIPPKYLLEFPESLMSGAAAITVSTPELEEQVELRFPGKPVFLVENCLPAWVAPRSGVLIANTDAFKMGDDQIGWFVDLLRLFLRDWQPTHWNRLIDHINWCARTERRGAWTSLAEAVTTMLTTATCAAQRASLNRPRSSADLRSSSTATATRPT